MLLVRIGKWCVIIIMMCQTSVWAQKDTVTNKKTLEGFLQKQKGVIGNLVRNLVNDTGQVNNNVSSNDRLYTPYEGRIIRYIYIQRLDFGTQLEDTSRNYANKFTKLANNLHHKSREYVIKNNLFFKSGDKISSFLMADNERHLRDQAYIQDVSFFFINVYGTNDSVDVVVRTKDVLSIGGTIEMHNPKSFDFSIKEDNVAGCGSNITFRALYDYKRLNHTAYGLDYIYRNIAGSFIDVYTGYRNFGNAFNSGNKQEKLAYINFIRPLVNPYTKWIYSLEVANHINQNMFLSDSIYKSDFKYSYFNYDAWIGWNTGAYKIGSKNRNNDDRLRTLVGMRYYKQFFSVVPQKYENEYYFLYADIAAVLASVSIFKQNFYKTKYFYGFGRNEDVPEGIDLSLIAGWVTKQQVNRPYIGLDIQRYYFTGNKAYYNFIFRSGSFLRNKKVEDLNVLLGLNHYSRLLNLGAKWKQRSVIHASITGQVNQVLNAPLSIESNYGLPEWRNSGLRGGDVRTTVKAESIFFSPFTFINFRFAPFIFCNLSLFTPVKNSFFKSDLYSSIGGGIRTRNESLIFGTFELRFFYYPRKNFLNEQWRIETTTNIKFKYNSQFIKKPEVINVN